MPPTSDRIPPKNPQMLSTSLTSNKPTPNKYQCAFGWFLLAWVYTPKPIKLPRIHPHMGVNLINSMAQKTSIMPPLRQVVVKKLGCRGIWSRWHTRCLLEIFLKSIFDVLWKSKKFLGTIPYLSLFAILYWWGPYLTYSVDYFVINSSWSFTQWFFAQESSLYFCEQHFFCLLCFKQIFTTKLKSFQHEFILSSIIVNMQRSILLSFGVPIASEIHQLSVRKGDQLWEGEIKSLLVYKLCNFIQ